jgi:hypothetical protein
MAKKRQPIPVDVSIERDGKLHTGSYTFDGGVLIVRSLGGSIATKVGNSSVVRMAQLLLLELAAERRRETAAINALVTSRRGEANDRSPRRASPSARTTHPPKLFEIATRLDHIQALVDQLEKCHSDPLVRMDLAPRLQHEILAARLAMNTPR